MPSMTILSLALLWQTSAGALLSERAATSPIYACRMGDQSSVESIFSNWQSLSSAFHLKQQYRDSSLAVDVWDSSNLLPAFVPSDNDVETLHRLIALAQVIGQTGGAWSLDPPRRPTLAPTESLSLTKMGADQRSQLLQAIPNSHEASVRDDAVVRLGLSPYVAFRGADGQFRQFFFKPSASQGTRLHTDIAASLEHLDARTPKELRGSFHESPIEVGDGPQILTVQHLVDLLRKATPLELIADRRVAQDRVFIKCRERYASPGLLSDTLAHSMNMYWRKVGSVYELACSPRDPRELARKLFLEKTAIQAKQLVAFLEHSGCLPPGLTAADLMSGEGLLGDVAQGVLEQMAESLDFPGAEDRQAFFNILRDDNFLQGTVTLSASGVLSVVSPTAGVDIGVGIDLQGLGG